MLAAKKKPRCILHAQVCTSLESGWRPSRRARLMAAVVDWTKRVAVEGSEWTLLPPAVPRSKHHFDSDVAEVRDATRAARADSSPVFLCNCSPMFGHP